MNMTGIYNKRGFKSRGERLIGEFLDSKSMLYFYEFPLALIDGEKLRIWYPDFRLPEYQLIIEFLGMNNDKDYDKMTERKKRAFEENYIDAIFLTENMLNEDWKTNLINDIEKTVKTRYEKFQGLLEKFH